jgi:preprotein translocase subunit YajC
VSVAAGPIVVQIGAVLLVALVAFVVLVRPQLNRMAEHRRFLASLSIGDAVITQGGLIGHIEAFDHADVVRLSVAASVSVKVTRNCIESRYIGSREV